MPLTCEPAAPLAHVRQVVRVEQRVLVHQVHEGRQDSGDAPSVDRVADEALCVPRLSHAP